jgi:hypothetical protein
MRLGKTWKQRSAIVQTNNEKLFDEMIPKKVFAWKPVPINNGQWIWLEYLWRYAEILSGIGYATQYYYFLSQEEALKHSRQLNLRGPLDCEIREAARKRL